MIYIVIVCLVVGFLYILLLRRYDRYEKENFLTLVGACLVGGVIAVILTLITANLIYPKDGNQDLELALMVGAVEESAKLLALFIIYPFIKKELNETVDGILYMAMIALGFALIENIQYVGIYGIEVLLPRSIICNIGHMVFSGFMGLSFYIHKTNKKNWLGLIAALFFASLGHAIYDAILFEKWNTYYAIGVDIIMLLFSFYCLRISLAFSTFKKNFQIKNIEIKGNGNSVLCPQCNDTLIFNKSKFENIELELCSGCQKFAQLNHKNSKRLLKYFRPLLRRKKWLKTLQYDLPKGVLSNADTRTLAGKVGPLNDWLIAGNQKDLEKALKRPIIGLFLRVLGLSKLLPA